MRSLCFPPITARCMRSFVSCHCGQAMVDFFITGLEKVPHSKTIDIIAVRKAGIKAQHCPGE